MAARVCRAPGSPSHRVLRVWPSAACMRSRQEGVRADAGDQAACRCSDSGGQARATAPEWSVGWRERVRHPMPGAHRVFGLIAWGTGEKTPICDPRGLARATGRVGVEV